MTPSLSAFLRLVIGLALFFVSFDHAGPGARAWWRLGAGIGGALAGNGLGALWFARARAHGMRHR